MAETANEYTEEMKAADRELLIAARKAQGLDEFGRPLSATGNSQAEPLSKFAPRIPLAAEVTNDPMRGAAGEWEPTCVSCGTQLGYFAKDGYYAKGRTLCKRCTDGGTAARLLAAGISYREMSEPLEALVRPLNDPRNKGLDPIILRERDSNFMRYMDFLKRFATLKSGERLDPPFAFAYGSYGVGKGAGAERALRDAIRNGCAGRNVKFSHLLGKIYDTYSRDPEDRDERTEAVVRVYSSIHLLVVHEVGQDADTDHALRYFYDFVDDRFAACLPTIFTSNYAPDEGSIGARMGNRASDDVRIGAILDRISGGVRENVFHLVGPSWRGYDPASA